MVLYRGGREAILGLQALVPRRHEVGRRYERKRDIVFEVLRRDELPRESMTLLRVMKGEEVEDTKDV